MKPKANQQWKQISTGATYTVFSVKYVWKRDAIQHVKIRQVTAFTHDAAVLEDEGANGDWNGKPCRWIDAKETNFVDNFTKV